MKGKTTIHKKKLFDIHLLKLQCNPNNYLTMTEA